LKRAEPHRKEGQKILPVVFGSKKWLAEGLGNNDMTADRRNKYGSSIHR
jgi:hypothetical protein